MVRQRRRRRGRTERRAHQGVKSGARGFGEMKFHLATDGPEFRRAYALAADLDVPILIHFQEVDHFENEGTWSTGVRRGSSSDAEGVSQDDVHRPCRRVLGERERRLSQRGGVSVGADRPGRRHRQLLGDYPNLYGDVSANSGNNMLSRDPSSRGFPAPPSEQADVRQRLLLRRRPRRRRQPGRTTRRRRDWRASAWRARRSTVLKRSAPPDVFRKITWDNAHKLLKIPQ